MKRYQHDIEMALEALFSNKLKSALTALGILFGVAAVISMLAIGRGAKQEILRQIELIGASNIVVEARLPGSEGEEGDGDSQGNDREEEKTRFSPGLDLDDLHSLHTIIPNLKYISPEIILRSSLVHRGRSHQGNCIGISRDYFDIYHFELDRGNYFSRIQEKEGKRVCIIGSQIAAKLFSQGNPVGQYLKFGGVWLKVAGVLKREPISSEALSQYGFNDINNSIYVPDKTLLLRMKNRKLIHFNPRSGERGQLAGRYFQSASGGDEESNYHQIDRIIMKVDNPDQLATTAGLARDILTRRHNGMKDFDVVVPELLLEQKQQTREIFNFVLGAIAGISLLVGGIGIMNIMFATVMERIREIGIRMAIGARKSDILVQFMTEAVLISLIGGLLGVGLGMGMSGLIERFTQIPATVTLGSILIAFLVSATIGVVFGYSPAKRAAEKDPIESLRHE